MSEGRVYLIEIGPGYGVELLTGQAQRLLEASSKVYFTGRQIGEELRSWLGTKLSLPPLGGEQALFEGVCAHWRSGGSPAVVLSGDGAFYSGEPGKCFSESSWVERLSCAGIPFTQAAGLSIIQLALRAAGWSPPAGLGLGVVVASPFHESEDALPGLHRLASMGQPLLLVQSARYLDIVIDVFSQHRNADTQLIVAKRIGWPEESIVRTTLGQASQERLRSDESAIVMIAATKELELPEELLERVSRWLQRHASDRVSWIAGPPGAGKTTIARAIERLAPKVRLLELGAFVQPLLGPDATQGGLTAKGHLADAIRAVAHRSNDHWVVLSADAEPALFEPAVAGETVTLLVPDEARWRAQFMSRPTRAERTANRDDAERTRMRFEAWASRCGEEVEVLSLPLCDSLLGARADR